MPTHLHTAPPSARPSPAGPPVSLALNRRAGSVSRFMRIPFSRTLLLALPLLAACSRQGIISYTIPKEPEQDMAAAAHAAHASAGVNVGAAAGEAAASTPPAGGDMANTAVATAGGSGLAWSAPSHWQARSTSAMRKGTYIVSGDGGTAELAITAFPGDVGGEVANVNRWRTQIQLPALPDSQVAGTISRVEAHGLKIGVVEMVNASVGAPTRVLGAWVPFEGSTWFFKLTGPDALVAREKPAFLEFLTTVKPAAATP
jgi:hypothetical protein